MPENLLAIDNGTQSVRAIVFDPHGNILYKSRIPIEPYYSTAPGLAEQDPEIFWKAVCAACQDLWAQGVDKSSIAAVSLTTQRSTLINVDKECKPLRPAIHWLDQRRTEGLKPLGGFWGQPLKFQAPPRQLPTCRRRPKPTGCRSTSPKFGRPPISTYFFQDS